MIDPSNAKVGDTQSVGISVRGLGMTEKLGLELANPTLTEWENGIKYALPPGLTTEASDVFGKRPQGEYEVVRTLRVIEKVK